MEQFHEKIRRIRIDRGLLQKHVAEKAGISPSWLHDLEAGRRKPSKNSVEAMAKVYGMSVDELLKNVVMYVFDKPWVIMPENEFLDMILED